MIWHDTLISVFILLCTKVVYSRNLPWIVWSTAIVESKTAKRHFITLGNIPYLLMLQMPAAFLGMHDCVVICLLNFECFDKFRFRVLYGMNRLVLATGKIDQILSLRNVIYKSLLNTVFECFSEKSQPRPIQWEWLRASKQELSSVSIVSPIESFKRRWVVRL